MKGQAVCEGIPVISQYQECMTEVDLRNFALQLRRDVIGLTYSSGTHSSHLGGELSAADIMAVLYGEALHLRPDESEWTERDILVLSKGHCAGLMYAAMAWRGCFERGRLFTDFNVAGKLLQEHCNMELPGIEAPTGSLGMGLSNGCGYAWCMKHDGQNDRRAYVLVGDGECTEGQTWEGAALASQLGLDNLICIVDYNKYIISSTTYEVCDLEPFEDRWRAYRWYVERINGHDIAALRESLKRCGDQSTAPGKPRVIICDTIKGAGISFMEQDAVHWHAGHLDKELYLKCMKELGV
ncbi:MAG: transketolase [Eubacteriales bacterium]|nr:transketolase [Eubacteriales bacterium]